MFDGDQEPDVLGDACQGSLHAYLKEISRYPLLTRSEELQLARRAEAGDHCARQRLIECNLRLVVSIARTYRCGMLDLLDLIQEGTLGLMQAVARYEWRRGTKLSSYAAPWIRHAILEAIAARDRAIRVPDAVRERTAAVRGAERSLTSSLSRVPSAEELAAALDLTVDQVLETRAASQPITSLDAPIDDGRQLQYSDVLADSNAVDPLQSVIDELPEIDLHSELGRLPQRSRQVIELRYGVRDGIARTADAVAAELGVARERVRTIELHGLRKLGAFASTRAA
jgi:RNA polymerase primary sigma factor